MVFYAEVSTQDNNFNNIIVEAIVCDSQMEEKQFSSILGDKKMNTNVI